MAEVQEQTAAQLCAADVATTAKNAARRHREGIAVVSMDVAVVRLENADTEHVVEERKVIVHTAANHKASYPTSRARARAS